MATVSQLCEALAQAANMPLADVQKYARALINSGDLPKAIGRSVPQTDYYHKAKLILALAASERPADCVRAMRDRYEAVARFNETHLTAGEVLAEELRELANKNFAAFQKWAYSDIEVSRGGMPSVKFRINEVMKPYGSRSEQSIFLGGSWLHTSIQDLERLAKDEERSGFAVSAFVPGEVLMVAAFGSKKISDDAYFEVLKARKEDEKADSE